MKFIIEVIDDQVKRWEDKEDSVFIGRLNTIIVQELQAHNSNTYRSSVKVRELYSGERIEIKG